MIAWTPFVHPVRLSFASLLWLLPPLCLFVAVIYKTVRMHRLDRLVFEVASLVVYMLGGLVALGVALWLVHEYWPF